MAAGGSGCGRVQLPGLLRREEDPRTAAWLLTICRSRLLVLVVDVVTMNRNLGLLEYDATTQTLMLVSDSQCQGVVNHVGTYHSTFSHNICVAHGGHCGYGEKEQRLGSGDDVGMLWKAGG